MTATTGADRFDAQLSSLTSALGDATRRGIYIAVRESPEPATVNEVASLFEIHPNVARHHLDKLTADGYLQVSTAPLVRKGGPGAGRPAKRYEVTDKEVTVQYPPRRYDLLAELLVRVVERLGPEIAPQVAEEVGREYGTELAAEVGLPEDEGFDTAVAAVAKAMMGVGFGTRVEDDHMLVTSYCPFGTTATNHPEVVCKLDQGIVTGLMEAAQQTSVPQVFPHQRLEDDCVTEI